jgi:hypothetical protein
MSLDLKQPLVVNKAGVVSDVIEGEVVIINLESGNYYSIAVTGVEIWEALNEGATLEEIIERVSQHYEAKQGEISSGVSAFIAQLQGEQLIINAENKGQRKLERTGGEEKRLFEAPRLEVFTDMQDFLLVDPIHEVDERGFPKVNRPKGV